MYSAQVPFCRSIDSVVAGIPVLLGGAEPRPQHRSARKLSPIYATVNMVRVSEKTRNPQSKTPHARIPLGEERKGEREVRMSLTLRKTLGQALADRRSITISTLLHLATLQSLLPSSHLDCHTSPQSSWCRRILFRSLGMMCFKARSSV